MPQKQMKRKTRSSTLDGTWKSMEREERRGEEEIGWSRAGLTVTPGEWL